MNIVVCIKQVPDTQKVQVDSETGVLLRNGIESKMNPYDLYALQTAVKIKEMATGNIIAITMGPPSAKEVLKEAFALGADEAYLLTDRKFAGADVLATSFTLSQGIQTLKMNIDLIICGKQTTDGDTAQVGPAIAEYLGIPHVSWVSELLQVNQNSILIKQDLGNFYAKTEMNFPCLITVEKGILVPSLPSYRLMKAAKNKEIHTIRYQDLAIQDENYYGLSGSPTQVERIFEPESNHEVERYEGNSKELSEQLYQQLVKLKFVDAEGEI